MPRDRGRVLLPYVRILQPREVELQQPGARDERRAPHLHDEAHRAPDGTVIAVEQRARARAAVCEEGAIAPLEEYVVELVRLACARVEPGAVELLLEVGGERAELVQLEPSA